MKQFTTFRLDKQLFGTEVLLVREINQQMEITPVPQSTDYVRGLINLRGQIITIFDLGIRLGMAPREIGPESHIVVLKTEDELSLVRAHEGRDDLTTSADPVGMLVDAVGDVVEAHEAEIEAPPPNVGAVDGRFLSSVVKLDRDVLVILNVAEALKENGGES